MKFLIFNIVVAAALVHLYVGEGGNPISFLGRTVPAMAQQSAAPAKPPIIQPTPAPKKAVVTPPPTLLAPVATLRQAAPKLAPVQEITVAPRPIPKQVVQRRAEVLGTADSQDTAQPERTTSSAISRRQALLSMAEDMEMFSVEAAVR